MIKNYTSSVSATKSVNHIEDKLVAYGAKNILKLYENKKLAGIAFILILNDKEIPFRIPARIGNVERLLKAQIKRPRSETYKPI